MIVAITLLGESKYPQLAGLAVLFPAVTVIGYFFLISSEGVDAVRPIILFSIYSIPTVLAFLIVLYFALKHFGTVQSILLAIVAWLITAGIILLFDRYLIEIFKKGGQL